MVRARITGRMPLIFCLAVILTAVSSMTALAAEHTVSSAAELQTVLGTVYDGDTVRLAANIDYTGGMVVAGKSFALDLSTHNLTVTNDSGHGLYVHSGGEITLVGTGAFDVSSSGGHAVFVESGGKATVTNVLATADAYSGACAHGSGSEVTVLRNATAGGLKSCGALSCLGGTATVQGDARGFKYGAYADGAGSTASVAGDAAGTGEISHGAYAINGGRVNVAGRAKGGSYAGYGACAQGAGSEITVGGSPAAGSSGSVGAAAFDGGRVIIEGNAEGVWMGAQAWYVNSIVEVTGDAIASRSDSYGANAVFGASITIGGKAEGGSYGVCAEGAGSTVIVAGNAVGTASGSVGAAAYDGGIATIDGIITAPVYIELQGAARTAADGAPGTAPYENYKIYTDGTNTVRVRNTLPGRKPGVPATVTANVRVNNPYSLDLATIFEDANGDSLIYNVSVNGAAAVAADKNYSYTPTTTGATTLVFTANDGTVDSTDTYTVTLTASRAGGGGGRSSTPATPTYKAVVSGIGAAGTTLPVNVNTNTGNAAIDLATEAGDVFSGAGTAVITVPSISGVNSYTLGIPASFLSGSQGGGTLTLATGTGSITIPAGMLAGMPGTEGKQAGITIGQGDRSGLPAEAQAAIGDRPIVQLTLTLDGAQTGWNNPDAPVTVSVPYTPTVAELADPEHIVVWYIDGSGDVVPVPNGRYDPETGTVTFTTTHFSYYAVAYVHKTFDDLRGAPWARKSIEVMASKGIINGTGANTYSPAANITRAEYLVLLIKTLGLTTNLDGNFVDVLPDAYYYEAVGIAKTLGIAVGGGNNRFNPKDSISRQDMMALAARALEKCKGLEAAGDFAVLDKFKDRADIAAYAVESLATLVKEGLITGSGDTINPRANTTRAEAAVFLYRIYNKYPA